MIVADATLDVPPPPEVAWRFLTDLAKWPTWAAHVRAIRPDGTLGPGSTGIVELKNGLKARYVVTAWEEGKAWTWEAAFAGLPLAFDQRVDWRSTGGSRVYMGVRLELGGRRGALALKFVRALYGDMFRRAMGKLQVALREIAEESGGDPVSG